MRILYTICRVNYEDHSRNFSHPAEMQTDEKIRLVFGKVLRRRRLEVGKTQESLALDIGFDRGYISSLERGIYGPTLSALISLSFGLGIPLTEFVKEFETELNKYH